jgi:ferredoxin
MYTRLTNSLKNSFGIVPGFGKAMLHMRSPRPVDLAVNIVDLYEIADFALHITDGVLSMDGRGPSTDGRRRHEGFLGVSRDGVCLDMVLSQMAGLPWDQLDSNVVARFRGLGKPFEEITVHGSHGFEGFDIPARSYLNYIPAWLGSVARLLLRTAPASNSRCTGCGICRRACPVNAIEIRHGRAKMKRGTCIMCLCCHELCPENAIDLKLPFSRS